MAEEFVSKNKYDSALVYYNKLFAIDPNNDKGLFSFIEYYRILGKYDKVLELSREFIANTDFKIEDKIEIFVNMLSNTQLMSEHSDCFSSLIKFAIKLYPDESKFHTIAADFYLKNNQYENARKELVIITEMYPDNYFVWEQLLYVLNSLSAYKDIYEYTNELLLKFLDKPFVYLMNGISSFHLKKYQT